MSETPWLELVASKHPADIVELREKVRSCNSAEVLSSLAKGLPASLSDLTGELSLELSRLAMDLCHHQPVIATNVEKLPMRLQVSWLRAYLCAGMGVDEVQDAALLALCSDWDARKLLEPSALIQRLILSSDERQRAEALRITVLMVASMRFEPEQAFSVLEALSDDPHPRLRKDAVGLLSQSWLSNLRPGLERKRRSVLVERMADGSDEVAFVAVAVASELAFSDVLRDGLAKLRRVVRRRAIEALGALSLPEDLDRVFELCAADLLFFGPALQRFLLDSHRHGVFVRKEHLPVLLDFFDGHSKFECRDFLRLTFVSRHELTAHLADMAPDDPRWVRRAGLLAGSYQTGAHEVLRDKLIECQDLVVGAALLDAAVRSPEFDDEAVLLRWLPELPAMVLPILRIKGGEETYTTLLAWCQEPLRSSTYRKAGIEVLQCLSENRKQLMLTLSSSLGPAESGLLSLTSPPAGVSTWVVEALSQKAWPDEYNSDLSSHERLNVYCKAGFGFQEEVATLYREVFTSYVHESLMGDFTAKRIKIPDLDQVIYKYGRALISAGRRVRTFKAKSPETGRDFLLSILITWLAEKPSDAITVAILETIARHAPTGPYLDAILPYWRRKEANVRRAAMEAILGTAEANRGLELSICRLVDSKDARVLQKALEAITLFSAKWAEPMARRCLDHENMSVKKAAADALCIVGNPSSASKLVFWIGRHDNPGFRAKLKQALHKALGEGVAPALVLAAQGAEDARTQKLCHEALDGVITLGLATTIAAKGTLESAALIEDMFEVPLSLKDASLSELAGQLHRRKIRVNVQEKEDPSRQLRVFGFSKEAALTFSKQRDERGVDFVAMVQLHLAEWLSWLEEDTEHRVLVSDLLLAATPEHGELFERLMKLAEASIEVLRASALFGFLGRVHHLPIFQPLRWKGIDSLRAVGHEPEASPLEYFSLLDKLGAVRTTEDLLAALSMSRKRPNYIYEAKRLLLLALQVPPQQAKSSRIKEDPAVTKLHEDIDDWCNKPEELQVSWLMERLSERPLGVPVVESLKPLYANSKKLHDEERLVALVASLRSGDASDRKKAVDSLLAWSDCGKHGEVLQAFLKGEVDVGVEHFGVLAPHLREWPKDLRKQERAALLHAFFSEAQRAQWIENWIDAWKSGKSFALDLLWQCGAFPQEVIASSIEEGDCAVVNVLSQNRSFFNRALAMQLREALPELANSLVGDEPVVEEALDDPLSGLDAKGLISFINGKQKVDDGIAVRAVHALGALENAALAEMVIDSRPKVRSAALRAFKRFASKEEALDATCRALQIETRVGIVRSLMRSLAHAKYKPALPSLMDFLVQGSTQTKSSARAALLAWGSDAAPALDRRSRKARPDKRVVYAAVLAELRSR